MTDEIFKAIGSGAAGAAIKLLVETVFRGGQGKPVGQGSSISLAGKWHCS